MFPTKGRLIAYSLKLKEPKKINGFSNDNQNLTNRAPSYIHKYRGEQEAAFYITLNTEMTTFIFYLALDKTANNNV